MIHSLCNFLLYTITIVVLTQFNDHVSCRKVEQVAEEAESLKQSLDKHSLRNQKRLMEAKERAELLGRAVCSSFCI